MALTHRQPTKAKRDKQECLSLARQLCDEQQMHQIRGKSCQKVNPAVAITGIQRLP